MIIDSTRKSIMSEFSIRKKKNYLISFIIFFFLLYFPTPLIAVLFLGDKYTLPGYVCILSPYAISTLVFSLILKKLTGKGIRETLLIGREELETAPFFCSFIPFLAISSLSLLFMDDMKVNESGIAVILSYASASLVLIFFQVLSEELLFRALVYRIFIFDGKYSNVVTLILSSVLFTIMHLGNADFSGADEKWIVLLYYFISSLTLMALGIITGGFESSIGFHYANNLFVAVIENKEKTKASLPSEAIFISDGNLDMARSLLILIVISIITLFCALLWRRKWEERRTRNIEY